MTEVTIIRPDEKFSTYRFYAEIISPDSTIEMVFAYEADAIKWAKKWHSDRGLACPSIHSIGPKATGGDYYLN